MGRFGIGARVRDWAGDEATIIGKRKGERQIRYDNPQFCQDGWFGKSILTPIEAGDIAPPATELQVGDRVRFVEDYGRSRTGDEGVITGFWSANDDPKGGVAVELDKGGTPNCYAHRVEKIEAAAVVPVAPATLTLEVGRFYKTRDGRKVGPIGLSGYGKWPFDGVLEGSDSAYYEADGTCPHLPHRNIVAEWVEPVAEPPPVVLPTAEVNVGDRVWDVTDSGEKWMAGTVRTVREDGQFQLNFDDGHTGSLWWTLEEWGHHEPVGEAAPTPIPTQSPVTPTGSFIVARLTATGEPRPNVRPRVHASIEAAEAEAQRLADRLGDEFAVYQRVASKTVDAGPVPEDFDLEQARRSLTSHGCLNSAFVWAGTNQRHIFWRSQYDTGLTHLGRTILKKWIAEAEAATTKEAA